MGAHTFGHFHFACDARAGDLKAHHGLAIEQGGAAGFSRGVGDLGEAVQPHVAAIRERDVHGRELFGRLHGGNGAHRLLRAAQVSTSTRSVLLHVAQLARHIGHGGIQGQELGGVDLHMHFARHATDPAHGTYAFDSEQSAADFVVHEPAQCFTIHSG